jgi:deoxyxylulose-5-phosphate synthase
MGIPDCFVEHGNPDQLRAIHGLNADGIVSRVLSIFPELVRPAGKTKSKY